MSLGTERIHTLDQIRDLLNGAAAADAVAVGDRAEAYRFISRTLVEFKYHHDLPRPGKSLVKRYIEKATGFSRAQVTRLLAQHRRTGHIRDSVPIPRRRAAHHLPFPRPLPRRPPSVVSAK